MTISSIGVGSNLPLATLLDNLRASQQPRLIAIDNRKKDVDARITGYGQLKSELTTLSNAAKKLQGGTLNTMKATVTGSDVTATATTGAVAANYSIKVHTLATPQSLVTAAQTSRTADIGDGGVISFTIGGEVKTLNLGTSGTSLENIATAINGMEGLGLQATILNNGSSTAHQLIITSKQTGTNAAVTNLSVSGNAALDGVLSFGGTGSTIQESAATNASLDVNGVTITAQNNTIANVVDGVTLNLNGASGASNTLAISGDGKAVTDAVQAFVTSYNDVLKKVKQLTSYDMATQTSSALTGDSMPRSIQNRLNSILNTTSSAGSFRTLADIGITTDWKTGQLQIDDSKLSEAVSSKPADLMAFFADASGVAEKAITITNAFIKDNDGLLVSASESASKQLKDIEKQYVNTQARIDAQMETYRKQFTQLDSLMSKMNTTSNYLAQQLSQLSTNAKS